MNINRGYYYENDQKQKHHPRLMILIEGDGRDWFNDIKWIEAYSRTKNRSTYKTKTEIDLMILNQIEDYNKIKVWIEPKQKQRMKEISLVWDSFNDIKWIEGHGWSLANIYLMIFNKYEQITVIECNTIKIGVIKEDIPKIPRIVVNIKITEAIFIC